MIQWIDKVERNHKFYESLWNQKKMQSESKIKVKENFHKFVIKEEKNW